MVSVVATKKITITLSKEHRKKAKVLAKEADVLLAVWITWLVEHPVANPRGLGSYARMGGRSRPADRRRDRLSGGSGRQGGCRSLGRRPKEARSARIAMTVQEPDSSLSRV